MDTTTGTFPTFPQDTKVASLGGGHGLFQTLTAVRLLHPDTITAIVTVADDGGSSGRIRRELGQIPPGDLRMALSAPATTKAACGKPPSNTDSAAQAHSPATR